MELLGEHSFLNKENNIVSVAVGNTSFVFPRVENTVLNKNIPNLNTPGTFG